MLMDVLGILIGFVTVILLLSIMVTALTQATQHWMGLRARNLELGVAQLMASVAAGDARESPIRTARGVLQAARTAPPPQASASAVDDATPSPTPERPVASPRLRDRLTDELWKAGARRADNLTKIEVDELVGCIKRSVGEFREPQEQQVRAEFPRMNTWMKQRFRIRIRLITAVWALLIAFSFQLSTPTLLRRLSTEPAFRAQAEGALDTVLQRAEAVFDERMTYEDVAAEALERLQHQNPTVALLLEEASGIGEDPRALLHELELVLQDQNAGQRAEIVGDYEQILEELHSRQFDRSVERAQSAIEDLALIDIRPWPDGWDFYLAGGRPVFSNWIGVLMTAILLSLGAPFWFDQLRLLASWRDALMPKAMGRRGDDGAQEPSADGRN